MMKYYNSQTTKLKYDTFQPFLVGKVPVQSYSPNFMGRGHIPRHRFIHLRIVATIFLALIPSALSQFCITVPQPATLSHLHSLFTSGRTVRLCPDFTVSGQGCDTNEQPFQVLSSDLTVVCDFYRGGNRCEISCPGTHFEVNNGRTLVLEGMTLTGATSEA